MPTNLLKNIAKKYCERFGQIAVEMSFISAEQLKEAVNCQIEEDISGRPHRLVGAILFQQELMTSDQIEHVMTILMQRMRNENVDDGTPQTD